MIPPTDVWVHPTLAVRASGVAGHGLFATIPLDAGTVVIRLGGRLVDTAELHRLFAAAGDDTYIDTLAVDIDSHLVLPSGTAAHFGNHGCDPTMWPVGPFELATRRAVVAGEELTLDYGATSDDPTFRMECSCRAELCRGVVSGEDWRLADLQQRYAGHWPPGRQRRIDA